MCLVLQEERLSRRRSPACSLHENTKRKRTALEKEARSNLCCERVYHSLYMVPVVKCTTTLQAQVPLWLLAATVVMLPLPTPEEKNCIATKVDQTGLRGGTQLQKTHSR